MPYGLKNVAQSFQRFMDEVMRALPFLFVYFEDILVASRTGEEHEGHLLYVRLDEHGLVLKPENWIFGVEALDFLGHRISPQGIKPLESLIRVVQVLPSPTSFRKLRELLELKNFYRRFVQACAQVPQPLTDLLRSDY